MTVTASVGLEIEHPNTPEHHIRWIRLYFKPSAAKFPFEIAAVCAHGEGSSGPKTSPYATLTFTPNGAGTLIALSFCSIHGLWETPKELTVAD